MHNMHAFCDHATTTLPPPPKQCRLVVCASYLCTTMLAPPMLASYMSGVPLSSAYYRAYYNKDNGLPKPSILSWLVCLLGGARYGCTRVRILQHGWSLKVDLYSEEFVILSMHRETAGS
jgi:hypothetical protein